jgi:hypothetical protein
MSHFTCNAYTDNRVFTTEKFIKLLKLQHPNTLVFWNKLRLEIPCNESQFDSSSVYCTFKRFLWT